MDWSVVEAAHRYADNGWRVLPLHSVNDGRCTCGQKDCSSPGKHPRTAHGVHDATTDHDQISAWWVEWPASNVGLATGSRSGLVVFDVDPRNGGMDSLGRFDDLPETRTVATGGGGLHFYFTCRDRVPNTKPAQGIDIKADGGYVVAPPSNHVKGQYLWLDEGATIAPLPVGLRATGKAPSSGPQVAPDQKEWVSNLLATRVKQGERNSTLTRLSGYFRNLLPEAVSLTILRRWNQDCCEPPLPEIELAKNIHHKYTRYDGFSLATAQIWTSRSLLATEFPPTVWVVENLLPEGLAFLAGRPKRGKSWLSLQIAVDVSTGRGSLGTTAPGRVLYLAIEDGERRLKNRLERMKAEPSDDLLLLTEIAPLDNGGLAELAELIDIHQPTLVVIDTLSRLMGRGRDQDSIGDMTDLLGPLQRMALAGHRCILLVDHHRKPGPDAADMIDDILGSTAKTAVADAIIGLYRKSGEAYATLKITGRDVEEDEWGLAWDGVNFQWRRTDRPEDREMLERRIAVKKLLQEVSEVDVRGVSECLGVSLPTARQTLDQMADARILVRRWTATSAKGQQKAVYSFPEREREE